MTFTILYIFSVFYRVLNSLYTCFPYDLLIATKIRFLLAYLNKNRLPEIVGDFSRLFKIGDKAVAFTDSQRILRAVELILF